MKAILEFELPKEQEDFDDAVNAARYKNILHEVEQQVFRPARKHGYAQQNIQDLITKLDATSPEDVPATELISLLEDLYYSLKNEALADR